MPNYNEKTAARLMNALFAAVDVSRPALRRAWIDKEGRMCACDGYRAYRLNAPIAGVPDGDAEKAIDLDKVFPATLAKYKPLDLPTLADVRAMIAEDKRNKKRGDAGRFVFTFGQSDAGEQFPAVDLKLLADMLQMFPDARAYYSTLVGPIVIKSSDGDGLLMPIRITEKSKCDATKRRQAPAPVQKKDNAPVLGLRTFAALYA